MSTQNICRPKRSTQKKFRPNNGRPKKVDPKMVDPLKPFKSTFIWGRPNFRVDRLKSFGSTFFGSTFFGSTFLGRHFFWVDLSELSQPVDFQVDPPGRLRTLTKSKNIRWNSARGIHFLGTFFLYHILN